MRAEAWRSSLYAWVARLDQLAPCQGRVRLKRELELRPEMCVVTWRRLIGLRGAVAKSGIFGCSRGPRRDAIRARGSVLAGAEPRGTCLVPSGCSLTGLTRATCDARARPRGCARRGVSPNVSDRLPRRLWASPRGRALAGRWRTIPAAARGCPGRSRSGGGASSRSNPSPEPLSFAASRNPNDAAPSPMAAPMCVLRAVPGILHAGARARW